MPPKVLDGLQSEDPTERLPLKTSGGRRFGTSRRWLAVPSVLGVFTALTGVPLTVTFDGYLYLLSAVVVGTPEMEEKYHWIREPGYPVLIRASVAVFGRADLWLTLLQSLAVAVTVTLLAVAVLRGVRPFWMAAAASVVVLNPILLAYQGAVLQQSMLTAFLSLLGVLVARAWDTEQKRVPALVGGLLIVTVVGSYFAFQLAFVATVAAFGLGLGYWRSSLVGGQLAGDPLTRGIQDRLGAGRWARRAVAVALSSVLALATYGVARVSLLPWYGYKASTLAATPSYFGLSSDVEATPQELLLSILTSPAESVHALVRNGAAVLGLGPSTVNADGSQEHPAIARSAYDPSSLCGHFYYSTLDEAKARGTKLVPATCRSAAVHRALRVGYPIGAWFYTASSWALLLALIVLPLLRDWRRFAIMLLPAAYLLMYSVYGAGIDRYGLPLFPYGALVMLATVPILSQGRERWAKARS